MQLIWADADARCKKSLKLKLGQTVSIEAAGRACRTKMAAERSTRKTRKMEISRKGRIKTG